MMCESDVRYKDKMMPPPFHSESPPCPACCPPAIIVHHITLPKTKLFPKYWTEFVCMLDY